MRHVPIGSSDASFAFSGTFAVSLLGSWKEMYVKKRQTALIALETSTCQQIVLLGNRDF